MKKFLIFLITVLLCMSMASAAFAVHTEDYIPEPGVVTGDNLPELTSFPTAGHLWTYWQSNSWTDDTQCPYPDYITGVWSSDGGMENLTFGVTKDEPGEAGKQEILNMVENDATVSFTYQSYPYHELWAVQQALTDSLGEETGAYGIGIYEMENHVHIDIDTNNKNSKAFMEQCFETYGNMVVFEHTDGIFLTEENSYDKGKGIKLWWFVLIALVVFGGAAAFLLRKRFAFANGSAENSHSSTSVRSSIERNKKIPQKQVLERILKDIEK